MRGDVQVLLMDFVYTFMMNQKESDKEGIARVDDSGLLLGKGEKSESKMEAEARVLMENSEPEGSLMGGGLIATGAAAAVIAENGGNQSKKKKKEEAFHRLLRLCEEIRAEAERWDALADKWEILRKELQEVQDAEFARLEEISDLLNEEELNQARARETLEAIGVKVPADADQDELRRLLEREREFLLLRTQDRQREIDEWTAKIDDARANAQRLRDKANALDSQSAQINEAPGLSNEEREV
jgi:hypothetical protein